MCMHGCSIFMINHPSHKEHFFHSFPILTIRISISTFQSSVYSSLALVGENEILVLSAHHSSLPQNPRIIQNPGY